MNALLAMVLSIVLGAAYAGLFVQVFRRGNVKAKGFRPLADPFIPLLESCKIYDFLQPALQKPRFALAELNGGSCSRERLIGWAAEACGISYGVALGSALLAVMAGNSSMLLLGSMIACCLPAVRAKELRRKVADRRQAIVMALPELLGRLLLMVNAGENVMRALARCAEQRTAGTNPLFDELKAAIEAMKRGESLAMALEEMGRRCAVPEVKLFATTILINARRGGEAFVPALRELSRQMWDKRKAVARTLGEQASSRLAFPLTVIFLLLMVLVGAPTAFIM